MPECPFLTQTGHQHVGERARVGPRAAQLTSLDIQSQGVPVIAENTTALFVHQSLASLRACLAVVDVVFRSVGGR